MTNTIPRATVSALPPAPPRALRLLLLGLGLGLGLTLALTNPAAAEDVSQWRGTGHRGVYKETGLRKTWPDNGPPMLWKTAGVGAGYSSPVTANGKIYFTGIEDEDGRKVEFMTCLDAAKGQIVWQTAYGSPWSRDYPAARSTPSVSDGEVFAISGSGEVAKLNAETGALLWKVNAKKTFGGVTGGWGTAESPLVDDQAVYFTPGGPQTTLVALDRKNGRTLWKTKSLGDKASYVTPTVIRHNNVRQIVGATTNYVFGVNPANGDLAWSINFAKILDAGRTIKRYDILVNSLVHRDGKLFLSNGYNHGSMMFQLNADASKVEVLWTNQDLCSQHHGFVWLGDFIFGTSHTSRKWTCINAKTGKTVASERVNGVGLGQVVAADDMIYVYDAERGNVILVKPDPRAFAEVARFPIRDGQQQHWCHPVIANGVLYLRHGDVALAFDLKP